MLSEVSGSHAADLFSAQALCANRDVECSLSVIVSRPRWLSRILHCDALILRDCFSTRSGPFSSAPRVRFRQLCGGRRTFFVINTLNSRSTLHLSPVLFGDIVTIESVRAPKFRVTTFIATGRLIAPAECSLLSPHRSASAPCTQSTKRKSSTHDLYVG